MCFQWGKYLILFPADNQQYQHHLLNVHHCPQTYAVSFHLTGRPISELLLWCHCSVYLSLCWSHTVLIIMALSKFQYWVGQNIHQNFTILGFWFFHTNFQISLPSGTKHLIRIFIVNAPNVWFNLQRTDTFLIFSLSIHGHGIVLDLFSNLPFLNNNLEFPR